MHLNLCDLCGCYTEISFNSGSCSQLDETDKLCETCFEDINKSKNKTKNKTSDHLNNVRCSNCSNKIINPNLSSNLSTNLSNLNLSWGRFYDNNIFSLGLMGDFQLTSKDKFFQEGEYICGDCLKNNFEYEKHMGFECDICHNKYQSFLSEGQEGNGCASRIQDNMIIGSFGSKYRSSFCEEAIIFTEGRPGYLFNGSTICDNCIERLLLEEICYKL